MSALYSLRSHHNPLLLENVRQWQDEANFACSFEGAREGSFQLKRSRREPQSDKRLKFEESHFGQWGG